MGSLGLPELLVILAIVVIIFGANRLPGLGRGIGDAIRGFKEGMKTDEDEKDDKNQCVGYSNVANLVACCSHWGFNSARRSCTPTSSRLISWARPGFS